MTFEISRRKFTAGAAALGLELVLGGCATDKFGSPKPGYLPLSRGNADYDLHLEDVRTKGKNMGAEDYRFIHQIPLVSPCIGFVSDARWYNSSGNTLVIDYGIVEIWLHHNERLFVKQWDEVYRHTAVAEQGDEGSSVTAGSHVHVAVIGNLAFESDPYFNSFHESRFGNDKFHKWNHVVDPRRLRADSPGPLFERPYNPKTDQGIDKPYLEFTERGVRNEFQRIGTEFKGTFVGDYLRRLPKSHSLVDVTNQSMRRYEQIAGETYGRMPTGLLDKIRGAASEMEKRSGKGYLTLSAGDVGNMELELRNANGKSIGPVDILLLMRLGYVYENERKAGRLIKLTSIYIDHTNPETIAYVANKNPEHVRQLILSKQNYGQFIPKEPQLTVPHQGIIMPEKQKLIIPK